MSPFCFIFQRCLHFSKRWNILVVVQSILVCKHWEWSTVPAFFCVAAFGCVLNSDFAKSEASPSAASNPAKSEWLMRRNAPLLPLQLVYSSAPPNYTAAAMRAVVRRAAAVILVFFAFIWHFALDLLSLTRHCCVCNCYLEESKIQLLFQRPCITCMQIQADEIAYIHH